MMISGIFSNLFDPVELFEKNKTGKGMRKGHRGE